jgi:pyruvate dehydrogenase E1 component alpha subunit/2-oxoisovalerate dehydrogenase E1 component alpha subunit
MVRIRVLDAKMLILQRQGRVAFYGTSTGEEAAVIASAYALEPTDWIFPALRQQGALLLRGFPMRDYLCHLVGNSGDLLKGRQMPCHPSDSRYRFVSMSSCIGTQIPHAVGAAWAAKIRGDRTVTIAYMGDGASSESDFHVALNFGAVHRVPCVVFCQNNQWAISVPFSKQTASDGVAVKAVAYGMEGVRVDGNDALAVYDATKRAVEKARAGGGPTLIEAVTYRIGAHSSSDDWTRYRPKEEVEAWQRRDPIERLLRFLERKGALPRGQSARAYAEAIEKRFADEIARALAETESLPPPDVATIVDDVYAEVPPHLVEERAALVADLEERRRRGLPDPLHGAHA